MILLFFLGMRVESFGSGCGGGGGGGAGLRSPALLCFAFSQTRGEGDF
jgi:hypothetical protein